MGVQDVEQTWASETLTLFGNSLLSQSGDADFLAVAASQTQSLVKDFSIDVGIATLVRDKAAAGGTSEELRMLAIAALNMSAIAQPSDKAANPNSGHQPHRVIAGLLEQSNVPYAVSVPMRLESSISGMLVIASNEPFIIERGEDRLISSLTNLIAWRAMLAAQFINDTVTIGQLRTALSSRITIEQAKGILAERHHISIGTAFDWMRYTARASNRKIDDVAHAVVDHGLDVSGAGGRNIIE